MTDKQVRIKRIRDCDNCKFRPETSKVCSDYENCYMMSECICNLRNQLKSKEQELKNICKAFDIEYAIDEETGNLIGRCNTLYKKERECEELKKANDGILTTIRILAKNNIKLREILTKIKELAEKDIAFCTKRNSDDNDKDYLACIEGARALFAKDVLKIIKEVEEC